MRAGGRQLGTSHRPATPFSAAAATGEQQQLGLAGARPRGALAEFQWEASLLTSHVDVRYPARARGRGAMSTWGVPQIINQRQLIHSVGQLFANHCGWK